MSGCIAPGLNVLYLTNESISYYPYPGAVVLMGMNLVAHPGDDLRFCPLQSHLPGFPDVVCQGFLAVHMDSAPHGIKRDVGVHMVGRGDGDCINFVLHLVEHVAVELEDGCLGLQVLGLQGPG